MCLGLIRTYKASEILLLSSKGNIFLREVVGVEFPNANRSYHQSAIQRRLRVAPVMLTAYRAAIPVFTIHAEELIEFPTLYLSAVARVGGKNPLGNSRIAALLNLGDLICAVHCVCPDIGTLTLEDELARFYQQTARIKTGQRAFLFAGESYRSILQELAQTSDVNDRKLIYYGDVYRQLHLPIHLLSCDEVGAMQLRMMTMPDYRHRLSLLALNDQYQPSPKDVPEWDAMYQGNPFVVAVDMELRRLDTAIRVAKERGYPKITMVALQAQAEAVFYNQYRDTGLARVFVLTDEIVTEALNGLKLHMPIQKPYLTPKGAVVDAPIIQTHRKAGRSSRR
jgi:hypothetical protein